MFLGVWLVRLISTQRAALLAGLMLALLPIAVRYSQEVRSAENAQIRASGEQADRKTQKRQEAETRQRLSAQRKPLEKRLAKVEKELAELTARHAEQTARLAEEGIYSAERKDELQMTLKLEAETQQRIEELEMDWLEITGELEQLA